MLIKIKRSLGLITCILLVITFLATQSCAQNSKVDQVKLFSEIEGGYNFEFPNGGKLFLKVYTENGILYGSQGTEETQIQLQILNAKKLTFVHYQPGGAKNNFEFIRDKQNKVTKCIFTAPDGMKLVGLRGGNKNSSKVKVTQVEFESEGIILKGKLQIPEGKGPFPSAVLVHGSGKVGRDEYSILYEPYLSKGIAILSFDKRGVGESGGTFQSISLYNDDRFILLAKDISNAVSKLKSFDKIDPLRIGLIGISQGGWIMPIVNSLRNDIAFTISQEGPTVSFGEENYYSQLTGENSGTLTGMSQAEISKKLREKNHIGFDPMPYLIQMKQPSLWIYGAKDISVPVPESVKILNDIRLKYNLNIEYHVYENVGHAVVFGKTFFSDQFSFLEKHKIIEP